MSEVESTEASVASKAYEQLRDAILQGHYSPGERLTTVRLAEDLGVSRTPVRAALARLKDDGLVDSPDNRAAWVRPLTIDQVEEAYEIATALEGILVRRVATRATEEHLAELDEAVRAMEREAESGDRMGWAEGDERFHTLLRQIGDYSTLTFMLDRVDLVIGRVRFLALAIHPESARISAREHREVLDQLAAHDGDAARALHEKHLARVSSEISRFLRESFVPIGAVSVGISRS
jgi:GntR family transcriptional regulator, rspAB operon transcriptional repressor